MESQEKEVSAISIKVFCSRYGISLPTYYRWRKESKTPREIKVGKRVIIPVCNIKEWESKYER